MAFPPAIRFGAFLFRPTVAPTLFLVVGLPILVGLGLWQLERAQEKQALVDEHISRINQPPIRLGSVTGGWESLRYRPVELTGHYDAARQFLLDNRTHNGRPGYHVLSPFQVSGGEKMVIVNRGWIELGESRARLPSVPVPEGEVVINGLISLPPDRVFRLGNEEEPAGLGTMVIQAIEMDKLASWLGDRPLIPVIVLLNQDDPNGFVREWKPVYGISPGKHQAYAVQWFAIAGVMLIVFVALGTRRVDQC